jgi:hypothetical protein
MILSRAHGRELRPLVARFLTRVKKPENGEARGNVGRCLLAARYSASESQKSGRKIKSSIAFSAE